MINCEQFIYTAAKTKSDTGYQVIAKSNGISEKLLTEFKNYFYPLGIKHSEFKESRSLLLLKNSKIAFSIIKNIGIGFDGRPDTIYNHTIVFTKKDFKNVNNDTRIFEKYYIENPKAEGNLPVISIPVKEIPIDFQSIDEGWEILPKIILALFKNQKIAVFGYDDHRYIQNVFTLLPSSLRLISFSTLVNIPNRQPEYDFILTRKDRIPNLDKQYVKVAINRKSSRNIGNTFLEKSVNYLLDVIKSKNENTLEKMHKDFDELKGSDIRSKLILITNYEQFKNTKNEKLKRKYADNIFEVIKKIDNNSAKKYLEKIKQYSRKYAALEKGLKGLVNPYISLIDAFIFLPAKVTADVFSMYTGLHKTKKKLPD